MIVKMIVKGSLNKSSNTDKNECCISMEIQHSFLSVLELLFREPLTIIFTIIMMLVISPKLTLFVFIFIPISGFIISRIGKTLKRKSDHDQIFFLRFFQYEI